MYRGRALAFFFFALAASAPACVARDGAPVDDATASGAPDPAERRVADALGGVEFDADAPSPALREARAEGILLRLAAGRPRDARVVRARATLALRHHPTAAVRRHLVRTVETGTDPEVVAASLDTLARAFGRTHGAEVRALAEARADDPDFAIRRSAREAVARVRLARWIEG